MNTQGNSDLFPSPDVLKRLAISESGFVFDPASGHHFTVNETGVKLLRLLQQNEHLEQILAILNETYEGDPREIERDVLEFISALRENVGE